MSWVSGLFNPDRAPQVAATFDSVHQHGANGGETHLQPISNHDSHLLEDEEEIRAPYWHCMLAGGLGGTSGDLLMHSIDTVKTRQQGDPQIPPRYGSLSSAYGQIFRQEGFRRGLYSGVIPAFLGSFPGTIIFFGTYEYSKRYLMDKNFNHTLAYLAGGFIADFAASFVYVPSEVLKTRLQLQGRYNNPFFNSGYNYRSTWDAAKTIVRQEGMSALFYGYKATIFRDLPFSALQFAFYEQERQFAKKTVGSNDIGLGLEIATAVSAGGLAGTITCPLDVVKTRVQTQHNPTQNIHTTSPSEAARLAPQHQAFETSKSSTRTLGAGNFTNPSRPICTSSPNTTLASNATKLDTSSVITGLRMIYRTEGIVGLFRGVGPRAVWTSVQSGTMLVLYQILLKRMAQNPWFQDVGAPIW